MWKKAGSVAAACVLATSLSAGETEAEHHDMMHEHHKKHGIGYVVVKGLMTFGDSTDHEKEGPNEGEVEKVTLEGDQGAGFGIDLGMHLGYGFNVEFDFSYSRSNVTEKPKEGGGEKSSAVAEYYTYALDLVYAYHVTQPFAVFVKGGWEYEIEKIDDFDIDGDDNGFVYGVGVEYAFTHHVGMLMEYEGSTIEGPRGSGVFVGVLLAF